MKNLDFGVRFLYVTLLLLFINTSLRGQSKLDGFALINPKYGVYGPFSGGIPGQVFGNEFNFLKRNYIYSLAYYHCKFTFIGSKEENLDQFDLLFGKYFDRKSFRFQIQGGLGMFKGTTYNEQEKISTLGIPLKFGIKRLLGPSFSIGVDLQANMNLKYPIYMVMLSVEIGKLKKTP